MLIKSFIYKNIKMINMLEKYQACVVLHAVGDAIGYRNGIWELNCNGVDIHKELNELGGIESLNIEPRNWLLSDDTIFHLANMEALINTKNYSTFSTQVYKELVKNYKNAMNDMKDRGPGKNSVEAVSKLDSNNPNGYLIQYNPRGGGSGCSMRSSCIGLRYSKFEQLNNLIEFSIQSGMMTHHNPMGYLGGLAAALFTSYAIQDIPIKTWGSKCLDVLEKAKDYVINLNYLVQDNMNDWTSFVNPWIRYLKERDIQNGINEPKFPEKYNVEDRDEFYKGIAGKKWAGSCGVDSILIAYDALLGCKGDWIELCKRAMLHGGDSDSTGCIAASWYGALYGFKGVPENNYKNIEYKDKLFQYGKELYEIQFDKN